MKLRLLLAAPLLALLAACHAADHGPSKTGVQTSAPAQVQRQSQIDPVSGLKWTPVAALPPQGRQVYALIGRGGPFRYSKDGATFSNREQILPAGARSYYREYTVKTPGESDRGARRIICGGQPVTSTAECYYTADHYASFSRIRP